MPGRTLLAAVAILLALTVGCARPDPVREAVLGPGESVTATNKFGTVKVSYVAPTKRRYAWDGKSKVVTMIPRQERFMGRLGLYEPAGRIVELPGDVRLVVQEATLNYENYDQVYADLYQGSAVMDWVYTRDGLVVGFGRAPEQGNQMNVDVYQFLVRGAKPSDLKGAREGAIRRTRQP
jgi:hypothetical protein